MLSYITLGVSDLDKSEAFYNELLAPLGAKTLIKMERIIFYWQINGGANYLNLCSLQW